MRSQGSGRALLITDCDEVLLHMIGHFADWVADAHDLRFRLDATSFRDALTDRHGGAVAEERVWPLLDGFFQTEMHRQNVVPGAQAALSALSEQADIVILTNIGDDHRDGRVDQLARFGIRHRVVCNRGGKGRPVCALLDELRPSVAVFVDDLAVHHQSVANHAPEVWRLHMVAEPRLARTMPTAPDAHARIDDWTAAQAWIRDRFAAGPAPAPAETEEQLA